MRPRLAVSRSAVELIKAFEGFRAKAAQLDDGRWTIGYGHTTTAREGAEISETDAEALLLYDLIHAAHAVNEHVFAPLNQNQFDALVAFVFNIGVRNFRGSTTLRRLNEGRALEAAISMDMWRKADIEGERIIVDALVRRRAAEKALFLKPVEGWTPAPTPVLPPRIDYDAAGVMPLNMPVATRTPLAGARATVERAPADGFEPPEPPSASEAAAEAVIERLEALLRSAPKARTPTLEPVSEQPVEASSPAEAVAETPPPEPPPLMPPPRPKPSVRRPHPAMLTMLGVLGVGLLVAAGLWGFAPDAADVGGLKPQVAGLAVGGVGVGAFAVAAYSLLDRLGLPRPPKTRF